MARGGRSLATPGAQPSKSHDAKPQPVRGPATGGPSALTQGTPAQFVGHEGASEMEGVRASVLSAAGERRWAALPAMGLPVPGPAVGEAPDGVTACTRSVGC